MMMMSSFFRNCRGASSSSQLVGPYKSRGTGNKDGGKLFPYCYQIVQQKKRYKIWTCVLVMALAVSKTFWFSSSPTITTNNNPFLLQHQATTIKEYWTEKERFTVSPNQWRVWLERYYKSSSAIFTNVRPGTVYGAWGCGVSLVVDFFNINNDDGQKRNDQRNKIIQHPQKGFFKVQYGDMYYHEAESHLREIKACYLDWILGTELTMPCVGYRLETPTMQRMIYQRKAIKKIFDNLHCISNHNSKSNFTTIKLTRSHAEGSMMLWLENVEPVLKKKAIKAAKKRKDNGLNHAVFHYLGACMKSRKNFFYSKSQSRYVAIDNDRCFTPESIINDAAMSGDHVFERVLVWKNLTYEYACHLPPKVRNVLLVAAKASEDSLSKRLVTELQRDVLSEHLLTSQPETFSELDARVNRLVDHIKRSCSFNESAAQ